MSVAGGLRAEVVAIDDALTELEETCAREDKSFAAAQRMVRHVTDGLSPIEATSLVLRLIQGGSQVKQTNGAAPAIGLEDMLKNIDGRRAAVAAKLEQLAKDRAALRAEEKQLNQAATALRKITGADNREFNCDICELAFASRQGLATHKTRQHANRKGRKSALRDARKAVGV